MVGIAIHEHNGADVVQFAFKFVARANHQGSMDQSILINFLFRWTRTVQSHLLTCKCQFLVDEVIYSDSLFSTITSKKGKEPQHFSSKVKRKKR